MLKLLDMSQICWIIYRYLAHTIHWTTTNCWDSARYYNLNTVHIFENVQNKMHKLLNRVEQFTDQTKKPKKYQIVGIELSINDNTESSFASVSIYFRFMLCNLQTQLIRFIDKPK